MAEPAGAHTHSVYPWRYSDTLGRLAAEKLSAAFGEEFVAENKPGAFRNELAGKG